MEYPNIFAQYGYEEAQINKRLDEIIHTLFYGSEDERIYHPVGDDMGYIEDTGNHDVRTEGMSYGMMLCVQRNMKEEFDRIWQWAKTYMYLEKGQNKGYFCWSCGVDGKKNSDGAAPDGEEYFAMALFLASERWGDGDGIFCYSEQAKEILYAAVHKKGIHGAPMWNNENHLILFVAGADFTDPSYHLPHFYERYAEFLEGEERTFFLEAAKASREYLKLACHPQTGLAAEYAEFDGTPCKGMPGSKEEHDKYYSDAYRVIMNLGLDTVWSGEQTWETECADKIQTFFMETKKDEPYRIYEICGTTIPDSAALHPVGIIASNAMGSLAARGKYRKACVDLFWNTPLRTGDRRYYDNFLYAFAFLSLSGNYRKSFEREQGI